MDLVGINEFARRKGVSHTLVGRALKNGRIVDNPIGSKKIDWDTQSVAFDNNCNLKFKLASKTRGEMQRALMIRTTENTVVERVAPIVRAPKPVAVAVVKPAKPAPIPKEKPVPKPVQTPVRKDEPKLVETPIAEHEPVIDPVIPEASIPRKPKVGRLPAPRPPVSEADEEDMAAEKEAAKQRENYNRARAAEQIIKAQLLDLELKQKRKELMPVIEAKKAVQKMASFVKKGVDGVADRICDELAGMTDPHEIHALLTRENNHIFKELSDAANGFAS